MISGLTPFALYDVQVVAQRVGSPLVALANTIRFVAEIGEGGGDGIPDSAPTVVTADASEVSQTGAVLNGEVNPNDGASLFFF